MIKCQPNVDQGLMRITGTTPNGNATVTREVAGVSPVLLRGGIRTITTGGISMDDTEAPLGVPLTYRVAVSGISPADRVVQQNLIPTPTFTHGVQGWLAGSAAGRSLVVEADASAHSASVGHFIGSTAGTAAPSPPTFVGHVDSTVFVNASYTLTPPTTGGTAIATADWMVLVHQQLASVATPTVSGAWTLIDDTTNDTIRQLVWAQKRTAGDQSSAVGYTIALTPGALATGTLLWVRGATQDVTVKTPTAVAAGSTLTLATASTSVLRPRLTVSLFSAVTQTAVAAPATANGGTWQYTRSSGTNARTLAVVTDTGINAGYTQSAIVSYGDIVNDGIAAQLSFQTSASLTNRTIARAQIVALPGSTQPYRLTGRFRYSSTALNTWQQIKTYGTWQQVKTDKATWLGVRGSASTTSGDFLSLYLTIVDPGTGADYITPVQIYTASEGRMGLWTDFSALFTTATTIPATAEVRLVHGTTVPEYATDIWLDEFGITPGVQWLSHPNLFWFDGDTPVPADPASYPQPGFVADSSDSSITWTGTVGNSVSVFTGPSAMHAVTTCQLDESDSARILPCEPVLISDPVNVTLAIWMGLIHIDALVHPSKQAIHQIINRAAPVAISQVRGWETGQLTLLTMNTDQRNQVLNVISSGRIVLLRNPIPDYPENNWYLALGDITEDRPVPNQRVTVREWTMPFVRVERPSGLIEAGGGRTWQQIKDLGTWQTVRDTNQDWLSVLAGSSVS
jgi:hypothetical protein